MLVGRHHIFLQQPAGLGRLSAVSLLPAKQDDEVLAEINITPFTDVLLVLLIIFMILAALVTPPGFEKQLANQNAKPPPKNRVTKSIEIVVNDRGVIFVDGARTDRAGIYPVMVQERARFGNRHVRITGDTKTPYAAIISILDACKAAALDDVEFVSG